MKRFCDIDTILLDIDDTIMDFGKGQKIAFDFTFEGLGVTCTESQYAEYDRINLKYWRMFERGEISREELSVARFTEFFAYLGITADPEKAEEVYKSKLGEMCFYLEGAESGIKKLKEKYKIYIVTNGTKEIQISRMRLSGLDKLIDGAFISEDVGYWKPSKEFFDCVFDATGADRNRTLIVGDSLTSDIQGGKNAGITTVWFNRSDRKPSESIIPDFRADSWEELIKLFN